jgi:hypothetical protein
MHDNGVRLRTSQYRQLHVGLVKMYCMRRAAEFSEAAAAMASVTHGQAGHSAETAHRAYGVGQIDMTQLTSEFFELYRSVSQDWHHLLSLRHGQQQPPSRSDSGGADMVAETRRRLYQSPHSLYGQR